MSCRPVVGVVVVLVVSVWMGAAQTDDRQPDAHRAIVWEYKVVTSADIWKSVWKDAQTSPEHGKDVRMERVLNEYGQEGWELVPDDRTWIFKRQKIE